MKVSCNGPASPAASAGKKMVRFPFSWQHTHVNLLNLLSSCIGREMCVCFHPYLLKYKNKTSPL